MEGREIGRKTAARSRKTWKSVDFTVTFISGVCKLGIVCESSGVQTRWFAQSKQSAAYSRS